MLRSPADTLGRDTLLAENGYLIECQVPEDGDQLLCGGFMFQPSRYGLTGNFERCYTTLVPQQEIRRFPIDDPARQYIYAAHQSCDTVKMGVWKRTGRVDLRR